MIKYLEEKVPADSYQNSMCHDFLLIYRVPDVF